MNPNPDERNEAIKNYIVRVYTVFNAEFEFPARDISHAREIAKRVITEGAWVVEDNYEEFFPVHTIFKCKIINV
jgi:hypothetical protein